MDSPYLNTPSSGKSSSSTPGKKYKANELLSSVLKLLKHFYAEDETGFLNNGQIYLEKDGDNYKKQFIEHLGKLTYIEPAMHKKTYTEIEETILNEWRKNPVLYYIRALWYGSIIKMKFPSVDSFIAEYNKFKDFVGQVTYAFFRGFFYVLEKKGIENLLDRLTERTAHFIITNTSGWTKVYDKILISFLLGKNKSETDPHSNSLKNFDI